MSTNPNPSADDATSAEPTTADTAANRTDVETVVPADAPVHRCAYCDRPFAEASYRTLHHGLAHAGVLSDAERAAFEEAYRQENESLKRFRIIALGLLVVLYFGFLFVFAVVT